MDKETLLKKLGQAKESLLNLVPDESRGDAETLVEKMLSLQSQSDIEEVELCVPAKTVERRCDLGALELIDTTHGLLFRAKGGMSTFVDARMTALCENLRNVFDCLSGEGNMQMVDEDGDDVASIWAEAWLYVMQSPMFALISPTATCEIATLLVRLLSEYAKEAKDLHEETREDVESNVESQREQEAISQTLEPEAGA